MAIDKVNWPGKQCIELFQYWNTFFTLGSLSLNTCGVQQLSDWYTVFFNPKQHHVHETHCTQEAVYPL